MNNSLPRLIDGMVATLRKEVIPHIEGDFARGQAYGVIYMLEQHQTARRLVERLPFRTASRARSGEPRTQVSGRGASWRASS